MTDPLLPATIRHYDRSRHLGYIRLDRGGRDIFFRKRVVEGATDADLVFRRRCYMLVGLDETKQRPKVTLLRLNR